MPAISTSSIWFPNLNSIGVNSATAALNGVSDLAAFMGRIPKTGTITGMTFGTAAVTTGCTVRGSIQTISGAVPSGTLYDANATGTVVVNNTDDNVLKTVTFAGNVSATQGDPVAIVVDVSSGTPSNLGVRTAATNLATSVPYLYKIQSGSGAPSAITPNITLTYNTGEQDLPGVMCFSSASNMSLSSSTTPDEVGIKIVVPYTCQTDALVWRTAASANAQAYDIVLYDSSDNVVASASDNGTLNPNLNSNIIIKWSSPYNLLKGRTYRAVLKPTTTTTWTNMTQYQTGYSVSPGDWGTYCTYTQRTDAGAWTDTTDKTIPIAIRISKIYQPGGSYF